jgi:hypothetical protein
VLAWPIRECRLRVFGRFDLGRSRLEDTRPRDLFLIRFFRSGRTRTTRASSGRSGTRKLRTPQLSFPPLKKNTSGVRAPRDRRCARRGLAHIAPVMLTGSRRHGEIGIHSQKDFDPPIPCLFRPYPPILAKDIRLAAELAGKIDALGTAPLKGGHWRLFRTPDLYREARTIADILERIHQYCRCIEVDERPMDGFCLCPIYNPDELPLSARLLHPVFWRFRNGSIGVKRFEEMVRDLFGALVDDAGIQPLDRVPGFTALYARARKARRQRKASLRRAQVCQRPKLHAKPPDFDPQPCATRFIGVLRPEGACDERAHSMNSNGSTAM